MSKAISAIVVATWAMVAAQSPALASGGDSAVPSTTRFDPAWTTGNKSVLVIRVEYPDQTGEPISAAAMQDLIDVGLNDFLADNSYGALTVHGTVTPLLMLPQTKAQYQTGSSDNLRADAYALAEAAGFVVSSYDLDMVASKQMNGSFFNFGAKGKVGAKGVVLNDFFDPIGIAHEVGHNLGLLHANFWTAPDIIGAGTHEEGGDPFDVMGLGWLEGAHAHFNACYKWRANWIDDDHVAAITESNTYRIAAHDQGLLPADDLALRIYKDADRDYWVELRQGFTDNQRLMNGVLVSWDPWRQSFQGTHLLDMTPATPSHEDCPLVVGQTFSDLVEGVHITPLTMADDAPDIVDVRVNLGQFPGNGAPSVALGVAPEVPPGVEVALVATGSDPDGDTLAYKWDFGDGVLGRSSAAVVQRAWATEGTYTIDCVVTDMKGHTGEATAQIQVIAGANMPPIVDAGAAQTITLPVSSVTLAGTAVDEDGTVAAYTWIALSEGASTIATPAAATTVVDNLAVGIHDFALIATDDDGSSGSATVRVTVLAAPCEGAACDAGAGGGGGGGGGGHDDASGNGGGGGSSNADDDGTGCGCRAIGGGTAPRGALVALLWLAWLGARRARSMPALSRRGPPCGDRR